MYVCGYVDRLCKKVEFERSGNSVTSKEDEILNVHITEAQKQMEKDPKANAYYNNGQNRLYVCVCMYVCVCFWSHSLCRTHPFPTCPSVCPSHPYILCLSLMYVHIYPYIHTYIHTLSSIHCHHRCVTQCRIPRLRRRDPAVWATAACTTPCATWARRAPIGARN